MSYYFLSDQFNLVNFLFMLHFAASELIFSEEAFAERSAAAGCLRDLVRQAKKNLSAEEYTKIVDEQILPVLGKGLMVKHDRVQGEFIQVLIDSISQDGNLGSITDLHVIQSEKNSEDETNFFDNMKHIQKHR